MTEIINQNNIAVRTSRVRPERRIDPSEWKVTKRFRLGCAILEAFCAEHGVSLDDMRSRSQASALVAHRRRFARICRKNRVGRSIIASLLHRDQSTIAAYLSDKIVRDKVARARRLRVSQKQYRCQSHPDVAIKMP